MKDTTALLIIDVQNGLFNIKDFPIFKEELLIKNIQTLLEKARKSKIPIFYIQHNDPKGKRLENGTENWKICSEISPKVEDIIIQKYNSKEYEQLTLPFISSFPILSLLTCRRRFRTCICKSRQRSRIYPSQTRR